MNTRMSMCFISLLLAGLLSAGCSTEPMRIAGAQSDLPAGENSAAYLDRISALDAVSENDALRGVLLLMDGDDPHRTFQQRVETLRARDVLDASWDFDATRSVTRGKFAYMIYQACRVPGGVVLTVAGPSQRYCLRELQYRDIMPDGSMFGSVSGMEAVAVLGKADVFRRTGSTPNRAGEVSGEE